MALNPLFMLHFGAAAAMIPLIVMCQASAPDELMAAKHEKWMSEFNQTYKDEAEKATRFKVFRENAAYIEAFNQQGNKTYTLGLNQFSDLTNQEFLARRTGYVSRRRSMMRSSSSFKYSEATDLPVSIDWNKKGAVTLVKDQGQCGCCWAFSAIAALEGFYKIKTGELITWSEQELLDCATDKFVDGCKGYTPDSALEYILGKDNQTMTTGTDYTYQQIKGDRCRSEDFKNYKVYINAVEDVPANNETALMMAVANQPVAIAIDGSGYDFQHYSEGVFNGACGTNLTHAVAVVGYGEYNDGTKYWLLKNSWGTTWGEDGYMILRKDVAAPEGLCGLAMEAYYPSAAPQEQSSP